MNLEELKQKMPEIFETVKKDAKKVLSRVENFSGRGVHRAGLTLGLVDMGMGQGGFIGGMHFHPGTDIVINKSPLRIILKSQPYEIVWAYTYHILLHEYIHSLGVIDEWRCRLDTLKVSKEIFKNADHPAIILAENGIGYYIPNLKVTYIPPDRRPDGIIIEYITGFDEESQTYFS
ncbi:MAG: hypothetical protein HWN79_09850 [Candidatus Lokiarchaeota archaeon]|nr:hypothetical protein [Candidatus Lokiarchaeota archaeon]